MSSIATKAVKIHSAKYGNLSKLLSAVSTDQVTSVFDQPTKNLSINNGKNNCARNPVSYVVAKKIARNSSQKESSDVEKNVGICDESDSSNSSIRCPNEPFHAIPDQNTSGFPAIGEPKEEVLPPSFNNAGLDVKQEEISNLKNCDDEQNYSTSISNHPEVTVVVKTEINSSAEDANDYDDIATFEMNSMPGLQNAIPKHVMPDLATEEVQIDPDHISEEEKQIFEGRSQKMPERLPTLPSSRLISGLSPTVTTPRRNATQSNYNERTRQYHGRLAEDPEVSPDYIQDAKESSRRFKNLLSENKRRIVNEGAKFRMRKMREKRRLQKLAASAGRPAEIVPPEIQRPTTWSEEEEEKKEEQKESLSKDPAATCSLGQQADPAITEITCSKSNTDVMSEDEERIHREFFERHSQLSPERMSSLPFPSSRPTTNTSPNATTPSGNATRSNSKERTRKYRARIAKDPEVYQTYLQVARERSKHYRESLSEIKRKNVKEMTKLRVRRMRERRRLEKLAAAGGRPTETLPHEIQRPATWAEEEEKNKMQREKERIRKREWRTNLHPEKKRCINEKRRFKYAEKKAANLVEQCEGNAPVVSADPTEMNDSRCDATNRNVYLYDCTLGPFSFADAEKTARVASQNGSSDVEEEFDTCYESYSSNTSTHCTNDSSNSMLGTNTFGFSVIDDVKVEETSNFENSDNEQTHPTSILNRPEEPHVTVVVKTELDSSAEDVHDCDDIGTLKTNSILGLPDARPKQIELRSPIEEIKISPDVIAEEEKQFHKELVEGRSPKTPDRTSSPLQIKLCSYSRPIPSPSPTAATPRTHATRSNCKERSRRYRQRRAENPDVYKDFRQGAKERSKRYRESLSEMKRKNANEKAKLRMRKMREKKRLQKPAAAADIQVGMLLEQ